MFSQRKRINLKNIFKKSEVEEEQIPKINSEIQPTPSPINYRNLPIKTNSQVQPTPINYRNLPIKTNFQVQPIPINYRNLPLNYITPKKKLLNKNMNLYLLNNTKSYVQRIGDWGIDWNIVKKEIREPVVGIFSMSFYRKKGYNSSSPEFLVYKKGLEARINELINLIHNRHFNIGKWKIRIYYERSVKEDIIEILNLPILKEKNNLSLIELFEYFFAPLSNNSLYHFESFGMFMRLLPLINDEENNDVLQALNTNNQNIKHYFERVLVIDIDRTINFVRKNILKKYLNDSTIQLGYDGRETYYFFDHVDCYEEGESELNFWPIINCFIYQYNIYYPYQYFVDFFNKSMELWFINNESGRKKYKEKCLMNVFGYGYDEYFTNNFMLRYYLDNNISIELFLRGGYYGLMYALLKFVINNSLENDENIKQIFTDILLLFGYKDKIKKLSWNTLRNYGIELLTNEHGYIGNNRYKNNKGNYKKYLTTTINLDKYYHNIRELKPTTQIHKILYELFHENFYRDIGENENITQIFAFPHTGIQNKLEELINYLEEIQINVPQRIKNSLFINKMVNNKDGIYFFVKSFGRREIIIKKFILNKQMGKFNNTHQNFILNI